MTGYPVIQLMALAETGTRALLGAAFGSTATGELDRARRCCACWTRRCWC